MFESSSLQSPFAVRQVWGLVAAVVLFAFGSCSPVRTAVESVEDVDFGRYSGFAWSGLAATSDSGGARILDPEVLDQFDAALASRLEASGLELVDSEQADLLVSRGVFVFEQSRSSDPYFTGNPSERVEKGELSVKIVEVASGRRIWWGQGRATLRQLARGVGVGEPGYREVDQERDWPVDAMVRELLAELPTVSNAR